MPARLQRLRQCGRSPSAAHGCAGCPIAVRRRACHSDPDAAQHFPATRKRRRDHHHQTRRYDRALRRGAEASDCGSDTDASAAQHFAATRNGRYHRHKSPVDHRCPRCPARRRLAANGRGSHPNPDTEAHRLFTPTDWRRYASKTDPDNFAAGRPARYRVNTLASATYPDHLAAQIDIRSKITPQAQI